MKFATFTVAAIIAATLAHAENRIYPRHCTQSDYFPQGMACKEGFVRGAMHCESRDKLVMITSWAQGKPDSSTCTITIRYKMNPPCVVDPAPNEPTCNHEARMAVSKRHGFEDMAHANMSEAIQGSVNLQREYDKVYKACMARHNYCVYRD